MSVSSLEYMRVVRSARTIMTVSYSDVSVTYKSVIFVKIKYTTRCFFEFVTIINNPSSIYSVTNST